MMTSKHGHMAVIFENLLAVNVISFSGLRPTSRVNYRRNIEGHEARRIVEGSVAEKLRKLSAVQLVCIMQRIDGICNLVDRGEDRVVSIVGDIQELYLN